MQITVLLLKTWMNDATHTVPQNNYKIHTETINKGGNKQVQQRPAASCLAELLPSRKQLHKNMQTLESVSNIQNVFSIK